MAVTKLKKNAIRDKVEISARLPAYVGYADYFYRTPVAIQIKNGFSENLTVKVGVESANWFTLPYETTVEVPFESAVEILAEELFSPAFLAENDELKRVSVSFVATVDGTEVSRTQLETTALPFDWWAGTSTNAERLAAFARPRISDCSLILQDAGNRLKKWKQDTDFLGYTGADKNAVRRIVASVFAAVKSGNIERAEEANDYTVPVAVSRENSVWREKKATTLQLALFTAACLEAARLHPVLAVGKNTAAVGVWLYESCFLDSVTDDEEIVDKYISDGINNLTFFDVEDLYAEMNVSFTPSETHFAQKLKAHYYETFVDIRRCRMGGVSPLPLRGKGLNGYELVREEEMTDEKAPAPLPVMRKLSLEGKQPKNKQWERRLLDLTSKNPLLGFTGKHALHLYTTEIDELCEALQEKRTLRLKAAPSADIVEIPFGGEEERANLRELLALEMRKGFLRVFGAHKDLGETAIRLLRRNKDAEEESGSSILYMAFGYLKYISKEEGCDKYAPLVLMPVRLARYKGNEEFSVVAQEEEFFVNTTLLEYLKQEFNIDIRGLGGDVSALKISEICAMVRVETANMKGWEVVSDVYLAALSFQRYLMWNDLRRSFHELKKNATVQALLNNRSERPSETSTEEDKGDPFETLTPLPVDSSQYSAIALSQTGASFVLHGPPGTGKSQTITNIIANALHDGKRVLFVAEKKAALDVVKKRLDNIGIGDFCLELHSNKTNKTDVLKRMEQTLALGAGEPVSGFEGRAEEIIALREELKAPMLALHKKRRLGISVYQAMLAYLQNKNAPDILDIESSFYDSLTEKKLGECKSMILSAAAAAKECGGVFNSPFENVNLSEYSQALRDQVYCACEVMLTEIRHLKSYLALILEFYRQKVSTLTHKKLNIFYQISSNLASGMYNKYFAGVDEGEFLLFFNANKRLDDCLASYNKRFKALVDLGRDSEELKRLCESGEDYRASRAALNALKKLNRLTNKPLTEEEAPKYLQMLVDINEAIARINKNTKLAKAFTDRSGVINYKRRAEFMADLKQLHEMSAVVFMDYNPDAFNGMCMRASNGYTLPVLEGYIRAYESFKNTQEHYLAVTKADKSKMSDEDAFDSYATKASALIDNIDMLSSWCMYKKNVEKLASAGLNFIASALESGRISGENILAGFEKNVYKNFLEINISADPYLASMTVGTIEDTIEKFRNAWEEFSKQCRNKIRGKLIAGIPSAEDSLSIEVATFNRYAKSNLRGTGLRALFSEIPELIKHIAPCMLMSPITVAQYLKPIANDFDLVIFDEASQMTTAEAIGSIARAKAAIVVGDPKQLPPTVFFRSSYVDEENLENEDLESVLDDCLVLGMPERHLRWHYRSKHESLIAFSNVMYYDNKLCTFPSPDAMESKVQMVLCDGSYDRGFTKRNRKESEALVAEVVRRLKDPVLSRLSMGIVTFSTAQREDIERLLNKAIVANGLDAVAYEREEPLFVKNLENVQGDERDVILFSVCYGPDKSGRLSLNFGPLNQAGGWRRLNVAVSRAREEMLIFTSMTSGMIDLAKTSSKGVAGLKAFLEFAERGRTTLAVNSAFVKGGAGIGKYIAAELTACGYDCRCDVGASDFKVDVAVVDPKNKHRFILAVICDGNDKFSVKDRNVLQVQTLKRGNWNVMRVYSVNYYNNPKREIKRVKDMLDRLTGADKRAGAWLTKYKKPYKAVKTTGEGENAAFVTGGEHDNEILARLKEIVAAEEPISRSFLHKRCLQSFGILKSGSKVEQRLDALIAASAFRRDRVLNQDYFYKTDKAVLLERFRIEESPTLRRNAEDFTPYEALAFLKGALEDRVAMYMDEVYLLFAEVFKIPRADEKLNLFLRDCVLLGEEKGMFMRSVSDRISLA